MLWIAALIPAVALPMKNYTQETQNFLNEYASSLRHLQSVKSAIESVMPIPKKKSNCSGSLNAIDKGLRILSEIQNYQDRELVTCLFTHLANELYEFHECDPLVARLKIHEFIRKCPDQADYFNSIFNEINTQMCAGFGWHDLCVDCVYFVSYYMVLSGISLGLIFYMSK